MTIVYGEAEMLDKIIAEWDDAQPKIFDADLGPAAINVRRSPDVEFLRISGNGRDCYHEIKVDGNWRGNNMNRREIIQRLTAIVRELNCMSEEDFDKSLGESLFHIHFDHHCWGEDAKILTTITMTKIMKETVNHE